MRKTMQMNRMAAAACTAGMSSCANVCSYAALILDAMLVASIFIALTSLLGLLGLLRLLGLLALLLLALNPEPPKGVCTNFA